MGYIIAMLASIVALIFAGAVYEEMEWQRYASAHCKVIGSISSSSTTAVGIGSNGGVAVTPVYIPGKTGYLCDDGQQVWR